MAKNAGQWIETGRKTVYQIQTEEENIFHTDIIHQNFILNIRIGLIVKKSMKRQIAKINLLQGRKESVKLKNNLMNNDLVIYNIRDSYSRSCVL